MKPQPPIYIPPPEPRPSRGWWLVLALIAGIIFVAGMCVVTVELAAVYECLHRGICN